MNKPENDFAITRESVYGTQPEPSFAGILSFMRRQYSKSLDGIDLAVVGVPYDLATTNRSGTRSGPRAIRQASSILAWDRVWGWDFDPFDRLAVVDYGDALFDSGRPDKAPDEITECFRQILATDTATLALGGDHFISYPILKAYAEKFGPLSLIHFDAHCDTWRDESGRIDHGTMFFHAANEGIVDPSRSIQMGMRTNNDETHGYTVLSADWLRENGIQTAVERIKACVGDNPCYLTFDIDFLDPAFAPGTGTPVIGGPSSGEARALLRGLSGINLKGMDLVEVAPAYDVGEITALAGASLCMDLISIFAAQYPDRKA
ncbi:MAG: agmatinase [Pseudomonadota bacterium]